jgi:hypothetical protein
LHRNTENAQLKSQGPPEFHLCLPATISVTSTAANCFSTQNGIELVMKTIREAIISTSITSLQRQRTDVWHSETPEASGEGFIGLVEQNHLENFLLWHEEDIARRDDLGAERVVQAKRRIDRHNQKRNDLIEKMDQMTVSEFNPRPSGCSFNSETPGMMIDRLSILALKNYHMTEESLRRDASEEHRSRCASKVTTIRQQISDLSSALDDLIRQVDAGTRSFRVYFQFKMYNDKELNPQLRRAG